MTFREDKAVSLWCPFSRVRWSRDKEDGGWSTVDGNGGFNRARTEGTGVERSVGLCIGSGCMAWRSSGSETVSAGVKLIGLERLAHVNNVIRTGFCGLAGVPGLTDAEIEA